MECRRLLCGGNVEGRVPDVVGGDDDDDKSDDDGEDGKCEAGVKGRGYRRFTAPNEIFGVVDAFC